MVSARYVVATIREVAEFCGVAHDTIKTWKANGMPGEHGRYDLSAIFRWRLARERRAPGTDLANEEKRLNLAKKRLDIEAAQRKAQIEKGQLLERSHVEAHLGLMLTQFQHSLLAIAHDLAHEEDRQEADRRLRAALSELTDELKQLAPQAERIAKIIAQAGPQKSAKESPKNAA